MNQNCHISGMVYNIQAKTKSPYFSRARGCVNLGGRHRYAPSAKSRYISLTSWFSMIFKTIFHLRVKAHIFPTMSMYPPERATQKLLRASILNTVFLICSMIINYASISNACENGIPLRSSWVMFDKWATNNLYHGSKFKATSFR